MTALDVATYQEDRPVNDRPSYLDIFYAPKVIPIDAGSGKPQVWRIWRFNPRGNCLLRGNFSTQAAAQAKLDKLLKGVKP